MSLKQSAGSRQLMPKFLNTTATICLIAAATAASAQDGGGGGEAPIEASAVASVAVPTKATNTADIYQVAFFSQYSPQNAFDMVTRLPGFSFDRGSSQRGFGGNAGNVLIDGSRPTSKSTGLEAVLKRIPAAQVERIEILRGGVGAGEAAGQSIIANVIRKQGGSSGTWTYITRVAPDGRVRPNLEAAITSKLGGWDTTFDIDLGSRAGNREALVVDRDADGNVTSSSNETRPDGNRFLFATGEGSRQVAGGKLTLNGRFGGFRFEGRPTRLGFDGRLPDGGQPDTIRTIIDRFEGDEAEFGVDWGKTFDNKWKWRLIGLGVYKKDISESPFRFEDFNTGEVETFNFSQDSVNTEFILRSTYGKTGAGKLKPEYGIEIAKNKLDTSSIFTDNGEIVAIDGSDVIVSEVRGEAFANFVYQATSKLTLDGGLTFEISEIKASGDNANARTLNFLKPRVSATYNFSKKIQLTLEAERRIGQLNFGSFASSTQLDDGRASSGNTELRPDKRTVAEATLDWKFGERGSIKANFFYQWRSDILENIILPTGDSGRGNAGDARFYGIGINLNLPLDSFLKGALLEVNYDRAFSSFEDPILGGAVRDISNFNPEFLNVEFRHDVTKAKVSYGVFFNSSFTDTNYQVDEIQTFEGNGRFGAFIETTRFFGVKARLEAFNLNTGKFDRTRTFFVDDRGGAFNGTQVSERRRRPEVRLNISGTF